MLMRVIGRQLHFHCFRHVCERRDVRGGHQIAPDRQRLPHLSPRCLLSENHPGDNPRENLESISHRCYLLEVAFAWEFTKETICLPLGCLQGGLAAEMVNTHGKNRRSGV